MSLIKCPECHKKISNEADKCVHCGAPITKASVAGISDVLICTPKKTIRLKKKLMITIASAILGVILVLFCSILVRRQVYMSRFKNDICQSLSYNYKNSQSQVYTQFQNLIDIVCAYETTLDKQWLAEHPNILNNQKYFVVYRVEDAKIPNIIVPSGYYAVSLTYSSDRFDGMSKSTDTPYNSIDLAIESFHLDSAKVFGGTLHYKKII